LKQLEENDVSCILRKQVACLLMAMVFVLVNVFVVFYSVPPGSLVFVKSVYWNIPHCESFQYTT